MKRIWQIEEQTVEDPSTRMRLEFSSVHSDELATGQPAPSHDNVLRLRMWTSDRSRMATFLFTRNGQFVRSEIESMEVPADPGTDPHTGAQVQKMALPDSLEPEGIAPGLAGPSTLQ